MTSCGAQYKCIFNQLNLELQLKNSLNMPLYATKMTGSQDAVIISEVKKNKKNSLVQIKHPCTSFK